MATTVYSGYSRAWRPSGSSVDKKFRAKLTYSTSISNTAVSITASASVNLNSSVSATFYGELWIDDDVWHKTGKTVFDESNTVTIIPNKTVSIPRTHSARTIEVEAGMASGNGSWIADEYKYATAKVTIPAKPSYAVSYNANGGSGAPGSQTKWYNETLKLQTTTPTRTNYTFKGWNTKADGTGTAYAAGANYTGNAAMTLYAQWIPDTYEITYDANTGTGSGSDTKTADIPLALSSGTGFSKAYHTLTGWNTAADGSGDAYTLGGAYTANAGATLYAQWRLNYALPTISNGTCFRVKDAGDTTKYDTGERIHVGFSYALGKCTEAGEVDITYPSTCVITINGTEVSRSTLSLATGIFSQDFAGPYSVDDSHSVVVALSDSIDSTGVSASFSIPTATFPIDLIADNNRVYMGVMHLAEEGQKLTVPSLDVDKGMVTIRCPHIDITESDNGVASTEYPGVQILDVDGRIIARFEAAVDSSGIVAMNAYARNYISSSQYTSGLYHIEVDKSGTVRATIDGKDPFNSSNQSSGILADARIPNNILRKGELVAQSFSKKNVSISANNYVSGQTISVAKSGYTPICIVNYYCSNTDSGGQGVSWCNIYSCTLSGTTVTAAVRNHASSTSKIDIHVTVLFRES